MGSQQSLHLQMVQHAFQAHLFCFHISANQNSRNLHVERAMDCLPSQQFRPPPSDLQETSAHLLCLLVKESRRLNLAFAVDGNWH